MSDLPSEFAELKALKVRQLKQILQERGVSAADCINKDDLVQRIIETKDVKPPAKVPQLLATAQILKPKKEHKHTVVFLHGLGDTSAGFAEMFGSLGLQTANMKVVLLNAPTIPITLNGGAKMPGWYDIVSLDMQKFAQTEDRARILENAALVGEVLSAEAELVGSENVVLGGFSQGGVISIHAGLKHPEKLGGIVCLSSYAPLMHDYTKGKHVDKANQKTPIFAYHGGSDPMVPLTLAQLTYKALAGAGVTVKVQTDPSLGHTVDPRKEVAALRKWLATVLK